jgi:FkbM family methyltransferase
MKPIKLNKFSKLVRILYSIVKLIHLVVIRFPVRLLLGMGKRKNFLDSIGLQTVYSTYHKLIKMINLNTYKTVVEVDESSFLVKPFMLDIVSIFNEQYEKELFEKWFKPGIGWTVLDVGAHYGRHTIYASKKVGQSGRVISIEPHPENFKILLINIRLNNCTNVIPLNIAVSDREERLKLYLSKGYDSASHSIVSAKEMWGEEFPGEYIYIKTYPIDAILNDLMISHVDIAKIDVEGAELLALKGAEKSLNKIDRLLIEVHLPELLTKIIELLRKRGFVCKVLNLAHRREFHVYAERKR